MVDNKILIPSVVGGTVFLIIFGLATKEYWNYRKKENRRIEGVNKYEGRKEVERLNKQKNRRYEEKKEKERKNQQEVDDILFPHLKENLPSGNSSDTGEGILKKSKRNKKSNKITKKQTRH